MTPHRVAVLISGRGTNLQALIDACAAEGFPAKIALVVSNAADAAGLDRARRAGIETRVVDHRGYPDRPAFESALTAALQSRDVELVCLAGFMRILGEAFVAAWHDRVINIHPSLLPAFPGLDTHARVLAAGCRVTGCTVHVVRAAVDDGPIIAQAAVAVRPDDTPEGLAARVLAAEHRIYPLALRLMAEGRVRIVGDAATVIDATWPEAVFASPLDLAPGPIHG